MKRILVGVDFSEPSRMALSKAVEFIEGGRGKILALHVVEQTLIDSLANFSHLDENEIIEDLKHRLSQFAIELQAEGFVIETKLVVGHPARDFAKVADTFDPDLVVLGAWGSHGPSQDHAGLTAKQIIQECRCDSLLIRRLSPVADSIVACVDFSPYDKSVVNTAKTLCQLEGAYLEVLHVFYPPWKMATAKASFEDTDETEFAQEYKSLLQGHIESLLVGEGIERTDVKVTVQESLKHSEGILSYLRKTKPEIVVLGARGSSRIDSMILGRIAERIVTGSETSVYIVKKPA